MSPAEVTEKLGLHRMRGSIMVCTPKLCNEWRGVLMLQTIDINASMLTSLLVLLCRVSLKVFRGCLLTSKLSLLVREDWIRSSLMADEVVKDSNEYTILRPGSTSSLGVNVALPSFRLYARSSSLLAFSLLSTVVSLAFFGSIPFALLPRPAAPPARPSVCLSASLPVDVFVWRRLLTELLPSAALVLEKARVVRPSLSPLTDLHPSAFPFPLSSTAYRLYAARLFPSLPIPALLSHSCSPQARSSSPA